MRSSNCLNHCIGKQTEELKPPLYQKYDTLAPLDKKKCDIELELSRLGHSQDYIKRALRVYNKHYGTTYDTKILLEIIYRLKVKDEIKQQKQICNIFHSKINLAIKLESVGFKLNLINEILNQYQRQNRNKPYPFDIIAKQILQIRANTKQKQKQIQKTETHTKQQQNKRKNTVNTPDLENSDKLSKPKNVNKSISEENQEIETDIIQTAINNFPQFEHNANNEINIAINKCKYAQVCECDSFLRINYILYYYQLWITSTPSNYENKYGFYSVINHHNYDNSKLFDDAQHLYLFHEFDDIYSNIIQSWQCDYNLIECKMFTRNNYNKSSFNNIIKNSLYFDENDDQQINIEQICDILHCYFLHSYDLGLIFSPKQQKQISEIVDDDIMNGDTLKLQKIGEILDSKQCKISNSDKYITLIDHNESIIHYEYFNKHSDYYVTAIYDTLKSELLMNGIAINEWNKLHIRAVNIQRKQYSRLLSASCGSISAYHIISLLVVCNFPIVRSAFMNTFLCSNHSIQNREKLIKKHSHFALFGKILIESVHVYGDRRNSNSLPFYHCFNKSIYFSSNIISMSSPLSLSTNIKTILNNNNTLITCKLNENTNYNLKYFDCSVSFISDWSAERELFMIQNGKCPLTKQIFKIEGMIDGINDYSIWLISIEIIVKFITGWNYDLSRVDKQILKNVENILIEIANYNNNNNNNNNLIMPKYIKELLYNYIFNIYEIEIDWSYLNTHYSFLRAFLCFNRKNTDFVSFNILLSVFKNCKKISVNGGIGKKLKVDRNIMRYLYEFLLSNTQSIDLKEIVLWNFLLIPTSGYISLEQLCDIFEQKFQKIHWIIFNDSESLIFQRDC